MRSNLSLVAKGTDVFVHVLIVEVLHLKWGSSRDCASAALFLAEVIVTTLIEALPQMRAALWR